MLLLVDFDGVIVDSLGIAYQTMKDVVPKDAPATLEQYRNLFRGNIYGKTNLGDTTPERVDANDPFFRIYQPRLLELVPVKGMPQALESLSHMHTLCIVSSTVSEVIADYLKKYSLDEYFLRIYGADVGKSKVTKMKRALSDVHAAPQNTRFITDTLGDINEASEIPIKTIAVTWGFHSADVLAQGSPLMILDAPQQLVDACLPEGAEL